MARGSKKRKRAVAESHLGTNRGRAGLWEEQEGTSSTDRKRGFYANTVHTIDRLNPKVPECKPPEMAYSDDRDDGRSRRLSRGARRDSRDSYENESPTFSRRASEAIAPPSQSTVTKSAHSEDINLRSDTPDIDTQTSVTRRPRYPQSSISEDLRGFAHSISSAATLSVRQDSMKEQATHEERQRDRLQRHKQHFITFIEDSELKAGTLNRAVGRLKKQAQHNSGVQAVVAAKLASTIQQRTVSPSRAQSNDDSSIHREISSLRAKYKDLDEDFRDYRRNANKPNNAVKQQPITYDTLQNQINDALQPTRKELSKHFTSISQLSETICELVSVQRQRYERGQDHEASIDERVHQLVGGVTKLQARIKTAEKTLGRLDVDVWQTKTISSDSDQSLRKLDSFVRGDKEINEPGLRALIQEVADQNLGTRSLLDDLKEQLQGLHSKSAEDDKKSVCSSEAFKNNTTSCLDMNDMRQYINDLFQAQQDLDKSTVAAEIATIRGNLEIMKEEQDGKDACITSDFERLELLVGQQREDLKALRQSHTSDTRINPPPTPPAANMPFRADNVNDRQVQELGTNLRHLANQVAALDTVFNAQQQKIEGLTSDHVLSSTITHLQSMNRSNPAHVAVLVDNLARGHISLTARQKALETKQSYVDFYMTNLRQPLENMEQGIKAVTIALAETKVVLSKQAGDLGSLQQEVSNCKETTLDDETRQHLASLDDRLCDMLKKMETMEKERTAISAGFSTKMGAVASDVNALCVKWTQARLEQEEKDFAAKAKTKNIQSDANMQSGFSANSDSDTPLGVRIANRSDRRVQATSTSRRKRKRTSATIYEDESVDEYDNRRTIHMGQ